MNRYINITFLFFSLLASTATLKAGGGFDLATADSEAKRIKSTKLRTKLATHKFPTVELQKNLEERLKIIDRSIGSQPTPGDLSDFNTLQNQKKSYLESLRVEIPRTSKILMLKDNLVKEPRWTYAAKGTTLVPTVEGTQKLTTTTAKGIQFTKDFSIDKAQKIRIPGPTHEK